MPCGSPDWAAANHACSSEGTRQLETQVRELSRRLNATERRLVRWEECWQEGKAPRYYRERRQSARQPGENHPPERGFAKRGGTPAVVAARSDPGGREPGKGMQKPAAAKAQSGRSDAVAAQVKVAQKRERRYVGGLLGLYYQGRNFDNRKLIMTDYEVDFDFGHRSPDAIIVEDNFSIRWVGFVRIDHAGTYKFQTLSDDGVRLWVAGRRVINNWGDHAATHNSGKIYLKEGHHPLRLDFYEHGGVALIKLFWSGNGFPMEIISSANLYHDPDLEEKLRTE